MIDDSSDKVDVSLFIIVKHFDSKAMSFQVLGGIALVPALENITKVKDLTTARLWWSVEYICKLRSTAGLR